MESSSRLLLTATMTAAVASPVMTMLVAVFALLWRWLPWREKRRM
jgi:uncharacterized protein involved in exopolysaccharide biosynthesis